MDMVKTKKQLQWPQLRGQKMVKFAICHLSYTDGTERSKLVSLRCLILKKHARFRKFL